MAIEASSKHPWAGRAAGLSRPHHTCFLALPPCAHSAHFPFLAPACLPHMPQRDMLCVEAVLAPAHASASGGTPSCRLRLQVGVSLVGTSSYLSGEGSATQVRGKGVPWGGGGSWPGLATFHLAAGLFTEGTLLVRLSRPSSREKILGAAPFRCTACKSCCCTKGSRQLCTVHLMGLHAPGCVSSCALIAETHSKHGTCTHAPQTHVRASRSSLQSRTCWASALSSSLR